MNSSMDDVKNKQKVAIVVVGYNRLDAIARLLSSLLKASYPGNDVPLVISIDRSNNLELYLYVQEFVWPFGQKYLLIQEKRLGLKDHIFSCGDMTRFFKAVVLLEDDLYVSPEFYRYVCAAVDAYRDDDRIAGISLYSSEFNGFVGYPFSPLKNGADVYAEQTVVSWGECWTERMWYDFRNWLKEDEIDFDAVDMPEPIKTWEKAWSKFFYAYVILNDKYFIIPHTSLTTNFSDAGEHGETNNTNVQVGLMYGPREYDLRGFEELVKYDVFGNNMELFDCLGLKKQELCVDLYGNNFNRSQKRFWLSIQDLPYLSVKGFALRLRPMELNVMHQIEGQDLILYDTNLPHPLSGRKKYDMVRYHLRGFNRNALTRFLLMEWTDRILKKFKLRKSES